MCVSRLKVPKHSLIQIPPYIAHWQLPNPLALEPVILTQWERGVSGGHDSSQMSVEYGANPGQQSFSCHCYLSEDKYHT